MTKEYTPEKIKYRLSDLGVQIGNIAINYITELEKACDETQELLDKQIEATYKLDKENAELKAFRQDCVKLTEDNVVMARQRAETSKQLIKAKELLLELYDCIPSSMADSCKETLQKVALFFKDSEVEK